MEEYNNNIEFKTFVDKYCYKHDITPEQAAGSHYSPISEGIRQKRLMWTEYIQA